MSDTVRENVTVNAWSPKSCPAITFDEDDRDEDAHRRHRARDDRLPHLTRRPHARPRRSPSPSSRFLWMASSTTMELSTSSPIPSVMPPSDMMLSEISKTNIKKNVAMTETGIEIADDDASTSSPAKRA